MTSPYTTQPLDAYMAAQTSAGVVLAAVLWLRRLRPLAATALFLGALFLIVTAVVFGEFLTGVGLTLDPPSVPLVLKVAAAAATVAALLTRRLVLSVVALAGDIALWRFTDYVKESDLELTALHLAFLGLLLGVHLRTSPPDPAAPAVLAAEPEPLDRAWVDDVVAGVVGMLAGVVICRVVLHGWTNSGDEWADTYQAALFAKLRAYGAVPHCTPAFHAFWVFEYMGRAFAQYTPGWPLFMAPFVLIRAPSLAGPASLGLLAAGVSRLGRRAAAGGSLGPGAAGTGEARAAGRFAAMALLLSSTVLINGGSRYPHIFVAALFAWSVEALLAITDAGLSRRAQWWWGATLGGSAAWMLSARTGDGCTLGVGLALYFVYALLRRRFGWRSVAGAAVAFAAIGGLTLVILRLQLGKWFTTGYSLTTSMYPWLDFKWSKPGANELKYGVPLASGSYCWWPCSPAVGLAGLAAVRGRAGRLGFIFFFSYLALLVLYSLVTLGRGYDLGYGPRYVLPCVVPMAIGTGVVLAALWRRAQERGLDVPALAAGGPAAIALAAVVLGVVRIAPLVYPITYADVQVHNRLHEAIAAAKPHHAVVFGGQGLTNTDPSDLPENLPLALYPNQDVLIAADRGPELERCVRENFPDRTFYRAVPGNKVQLVKF